MPTESSTIAGKRGSVRKPRTEGGTWSYRLDLGLDDVGKRRQCEVGGFRTKKEAQAALNDALSGVQRGTFVTPSRTTVREFLDLWIDGVKTEVALTAWVSYRQAVRRHINPHLGSKRLGELSTLDVKRGQGVLLTSGRQDGGRSPRTRSNSRTEYFTARSPTRFDNTALAEMAATLGDHDDRPGISQLGAATRTRSPTADTNSVVDRHRNRLLRPNQGRPADR